jgi:tripeptide aminopeptidase
MTVIQSSIPMPRADRASLTGARAPEPQHCPCPHPPAPPSPPPTPPENPPVNRQRLVDLFLRLTQIRGETRNERLIADAVKAEAASIGFEGARIKEDDAGRRIRGNAGNVIIDIPGNVPNAPAIMFCSHLDTVPLAVGVKPQVGTDGIIRSDGTTALGGDNRAGCAEILEAMREIKEHNLPHGPIQLVFCWARPSSIRAT